MRILSLLVAVAVASCTPLPPPTISQSPHAAVRTEAFVIAANPLAAEAGREVLARGGSAADAALAVQAMLSLVEPQSSGVGGGGFVHFYDARTRGTKIYDGREVAPAQASASMFLGTDGKPLPFATAVLSGRSTGVPGAVAALAKAQRDYGKLRWDSLFGLAERTARDGFIVSPRLDALVHGKFPQASAPDALNYFRQGPGGELVKAGDRLKKIGRAHV